MSSWEDMFNQRKNGGPPVGPVPDAAEPDDGIAPPPNPLDYKPWILQRGRGRPTMFIDFRRFEPKSGILMGCQMSYPNLLSVEYIGDRMVSLDYGTRQFVIEGIGLSELARHLQQGSVLAIQEYSALIWPKRPEHSVVTKIARLDSRQ